MRMTSKSNEGRKTSNVVKRKQEPTSQKPPGGSPKQVPSLGVSLSLKKKGTCTRGKITKVTGCLCTSVV